MDCGSNYMKLIIFLFSGLFLLYVHHIYAKDTYFSWQDCSTSAIYNSNSQFEINLNLLLGSLFSNGTRDGFRDTIGSSPETVYGLVQCRGDISMQDCRTCLNRSTVEILQRCPNQKSATLRFEYCILRYSNTQFSGEVDRVSQSLTNPGKVSNANRFDQQLGNLVNNLSTTAAFRESRYDSGSIDYIASDNIYGLVQCTIDLSPTNCLSCLHSMISSIPNCCSRSQGARIYSTTCYLRYEMYPIVQSQLSTNRRKEEQGNGRGKSTNIVVIVAPIGGGSLFLLAISAFITIRRTRKNRSKRKTQLGYNQDDMGSEDSLQFDLITIRTATNDFSDANKLGQGGFGAVYKGELIDGQEVAVKRLSKNSGQGSQEFKNEVVLLYKLQHRNLVKLFGFCLSEEEKLLIYEYVPNKSLDKYIFDPIRKGSLNWERRYKIIKGIVRGLLYLHEDSRLRIIHRDLKAENILLDTEMNAKIADFGTAKLFRTNQTRGNTSKIAGTFGYMAPEYALHGLFSIKSDVYSFGVLLLEIISGQKISSFYLSGPSEDLTSHIWKQWRDGNGLEVVDPILLDSFIENEVLRCIYIGLLCVQDNLKDRPTMSTILFMLNNYSLTLEIPAPTAFMLRTSNGLQRDVEFKDSRIYFNDDISYDFPR